MNENIERKLGVSRWSFWALERHENVADTFFVSSNIVSLFNKIPIQSEMSLRDITPQKSLITTIRKS